MEKKKKNQNKTLQMEGLNMGLIGNKIGSRSCAEGVDRQKDVLQLLLCCGFREGKCKVINEVVNSCWSEVLGSWESKHKGVVGSSMGSLRLH